MSSSHRRRSSVRPQSVLPSLLSCWSVVDSIYTHQLNNSRMCTYRFFFTGQRYVRSGCSGVPVFRNSRTHNKFTPFWFSSSFRSSSPQIELIWFLFCGCCLFTLRTVTPTLENVSTCAESVDGRHTKSSLARWQMLPKGNINYLTCK